MLPYPAHYNLDLDLNFIDFCIFQAKKQYITYKGLTYKQGSLVKSRVKDFYFGENNLSKICTWYISQNYCS